MADSLISGRDLGARGDNVADDTAALQAALDRIAEGKVATLYLPAGTYRITAPLVLRCPLTVAATIRGESGAGGGGGTILSFDGPAGSPCVLEVAGGFGVTLERFLIDARFRAQFGLYLHGDLPRSVMSDVTVRDVTVGSPLPGDSPALPAGGKSAAISIGLRPDGTQDTDQCDSINLVGVTITSTGDAHAAHCGIATGTANVKNFFVDHLWSYGFQVGLSVPNGTGTCTVTGGAGLCNSVADFLVGSGMLAVTGWESEGSARLLTTPGWHSNYASVSFDRCGWYGAPADDVAVFFGGALALRGCDFRNNRTPESVPKIALIAPQDGSATSLISEQNFYQNAQAVAPLFMNWNGSASLAKAGVYPPWLRTFGDVGGVSGALVALASLPATVVPPPPAPVPRVADPGNVVGDLRVTGNLTVSGGVYAAALDLGEGRYWSPDGFFLDPTHSWDRRRGWSGPPPRTK